MTDSISTPLEPLYTSNSECTHTNYEDYGDGMCYEGCCDRYRCKDCGKIWTEEVAD